MDIRGRYLAVLFVCAAFAGCGGGGSSSSPASLAAAPKTAATAAAVPAALYTFVPSVADPNITAFLAPTYAYKPIWPNNGSLVIFLPGRNEAPSNYSMISQFAANLGYYVLDMGYPNMTAPTSLCNNDPTCDGNVLLQKWNGTPGNDNVTPGNSVQNRISKELLYLAATYPAQGWNRFVAADGSVFWNNVVLAGHSLGSWEAGYIATFLQVKRVVMLGGPQDVDVVGGVSIASDWLSSNTGTPDSLKFLFVSALDSSYADSLLDATAMGMDALGPWTDVDGESVGFSGSHELNTYVPAADPHQSVAIDGQIPLDANGNSVFANAWTDIFVPQPGQ